MAVSNESSRRAEVAKRLRIAREMAGLSQAQVAGLLGLHRPTVSEIEAGRRKVAVEELVELARLYEVDVAWLSAAEEGRQPAEVSLAARELSKLKEEDAKFLLEY